MDNSVDMVMSSVAQDDAVQADTLAQIVGEDNTTDNSAVPQEVHAPVEENPQPQTSGSEPGWIKKRIEAGVRKEAAALESKLRAEYEAQLKPLREAMLENEADKLMAQGEFKTRERALEYLRLKGGMPVTEQPSAVERPRDASGRFAKSERAAESYKPEDMQRANQLIEQAKTIRALGGVDVMAIYNNDPSVKEKVLSGEWDFLDVVNANKQRQPVPTAVRSSNGVALGDVNISKMSTGQLNKLDEYLASGGKVDFRK